MTTLIFYLPFLLLSALLGVYAERKVSAFMQDRVGPIETGKWGLLQTLADILKLMQKEDIKPAVADKVLFVMAPLIVFIAVFAGFAVLPVNNSWTGSGAAVGVYYLLAIVSLDVVGVLMAGWGSNSKFSLYGALRSVAQIISYEIPLTISVLCVVILSQTLNLQEISFQQGIFSEEQQWLFGLPQLGIDISAVGGLLSWNVVRMPLMFLVWIIFFIASLAESNRAPFDLPEAESELIGGFHTEYSGFRWAVFMLAEYGMMVLVSILGTVLFWGSWNTPLPNMGVVKLATWTSGEVGEWSGVLWGTFWLVIKVVLTVFLQMWVRWTYPRLRVDQLMSLCWKYLIPISLVLMLITAVWRLLMV